MGFNYVTNLGKVINALKDHNTITASPDLSTGLDTRINNDNILKTDPTIETPRSDRFPAIYVLINNKEELYETLSAPGPTGAMKRAEVTYDIIGIYGKHGGYSPHSELLDDVYTLAGNIEGVFQAEYNLSSTALWCNPGSTEFSTAMDIGDGFVKAVLVRLTAQYLFR